MAAVLLVDDDAPVRALLRRRLEKAGHTVTDAATAEEALRRYREQLPDVVITDLVLPNKSGHELIADLCQDFPGVRVVAISGALDRDVEALLEGAAGLGALRTLPKPFTSGQLLEALEDVLEGPNA